MDLDILVIDDERELCEMFANTLTRAGYIAKTAFSAEEGLEIVKAGAPPLIFCDIRMPGKSGLELVRDLRMLGLPSAVVMITASVDFDLITEALRLGTLDYITKPFDSKDIRAKTPVWLELGKRLQSLTIEDGNIASLQKKLRTIELFRVKNNSMARRQTS